MIVGRRQPDRAIPRVVVIAQLALFDFHIRKLEAGQQMLRQLGAAALLAIAVGRFAVPGKDPFNPDTG